MNHWIITDGAAGNRRQAEALAAALGLPSESYTVGLRGPWSTLAPRWTYRLDRGLRGEHAAQLLLPPPRLVIGCGRQAAAITRWLRKRGQGRCQTIQILNPGIDPRHWDLVIAPAHDRLQAANVLTPLGSLHPVDDLWLAQGRLAWPLLGELPAPRIGVLLGGPRRDVAIDTDYLHTLFQRLEAILQQQGGSVLLLCSRRTPPPLQTLARRFASHHPGCYWSGPQDGPNPYQGVLAWADRLVVTPDSVNMLSEACASGRPVHCLWPSLPLPTRLASFVQALQARGLLQPWDAPHPIPAALRETAALAAEVRIRLSLPPAAQL